MMLGLGLLVVSAVIAAAVADPGWTAAQEQPPGPWPNCTAGVLPKQAVYSVVVTRRDPVPDNAALISHVNHTSTFNFSFTTAWFPAPPAGSNGSDLGEGLVVRVVECNPDHHSCVGVPHPEWTNAGALAIVRADLPADGTPKTLGVVSPSNIVWPGCDGPAPSTAAEWGAADPRLTYRPKTETYYLTWDNCTRNCEPERSTLLSTTTNPHDPDSWTLHGAVLPGKYTGGAALLFRDDAVGDGNTGGPQHYAFVSDSNTAGSIILATSDNGLAWTEAGIFMAARTGCWDEAGVAVGPHPVRLSTGDYLMIYNIDTGFPYRGDPLGRCAIGWAILDKDDPTKIVARSDGPLLTADLPWEECPVKGYTCQETRVVFSTGMKPLGNDAFYVIYGGADTDVGIAEIKVMIK